MNSQLSQALITSTAIVLAAIHMIAPEGWLRIDSTTLVLLAVAALPWLVPFLKSIKLPGGIELVLRELERKIEHTQQVARRAEDAAILGVSPGPAPNTRAAQEVAGIEAEVQPGPHKDDPWKDQFGGKSEANGRRLTAGVTVIPERPGWFAVHLVAESVSPRIDPLSGHVRFFLHPTFHNDKPVVPVGPNGRAELLLVAYGAFTACALADGGKTRLELDLSELADAPADFRRR